MTKSKSDSKIQTTNTAAKITQFELIIPSLGLDIPVSPNVDAKNEGIYQEALKNGVAHYRGSALPDSGSNVLIFGHSSAVWGNSGYATIFENLNNLESGDNIEISFNGRSLAYQVTEKKIISQNGH